MTKSKPQNPSTNGAAKKLRPATIKLIRQTHGMGARIARLAGVHRTYVYHVLRGDKPASEKLHIAISRAILQSAREFDYAALEHEHPEMTASV